MKAWRMHGYGDMRLDEVPEPAVKPGWVKVRIRVVQPSITETLLFAGAKTYLHEKVASLVAAGPAQLFGHEFSAVVVETGEGVRSLSPGDRVAPRGSHPDGIVGFDYPGAFAEYAVVPESLLAKVPDHVTDSEAAVIQPLTDAVAGDTTLLQAADMLRDGGKVVGISLTGQGALLPYDRFRHRGLRFLFPSVLDRRLLETTVHLVATGRVNVKPLVTCVLQGIERVPEAFALTANKSAHGLVNPAQVVIST